MPDSATAAAAAAQQHAKRPSIGPRHSSSSSLAFARSPSDALSSSSQRSRSSRHIVGALHARGRVPSYSRGINKQDAAQQSSAQKPANIKRNSSNIHLTRNHSSTGLRKNHSDTSLKRNKSGLQLTALTKLPRTGSSRHLPKGGRSGKKRLSAQLGHADRDQPSVRFDLGSPEAEEDAWEEASQSNPSTKPNTRRNSMAAEENRVPPPAAVKHLPPDPPASLPTPTTLPSKSPPSSPEEVETTVPKAQSTTQLQPQENAAGDRAPGHARRVSDRNSITNKLLQRNVSFTAPPELSSISASVAGSTHTSPTNTRSGSSEIVSRFLNGISSSGATRSSYLAHHQLTHHENYEPEQHLRKNQSSASLARLPIRTSSSLSGTNTPATEWTQENEDPSVNKSPPRTPGRRVRMSEERVPPIETSGHEYYGFNDELLHDQSDVEYRRIRIFHNPLADSIERMNQAQIAARISREAPKSPGKPSLVQTTSNEGRSLGSLSTSWRSQRSIETVRKQPRVMFQGLTGTSKDKDESFMDSPGRRSLEEEYSNSSKEKPRDEVREICRRLWNQHSVSRGGPADD